MRADSLFDRLMAYEAGEMEEAEVLDLFQDLVRSGLAWTLQGSYGRTARALIDAGLVEDGVAGGSDRAGR